MKIIKKIAELDKYISNVSNLGFVPTMGGLHKGHVSLIKESIKKCKKTLISIFINPTQFNKKKDFLTYPKNMKKDLAILKKLDVDIVFIPSSKEMYKKKRKKKIIIKKNLNILCGKYRKGHFEGVIDIVDRFLQIIKPRYIFLGEKDFQQQFLVKQHINNRFKTTVKLCKTIRNKNKIALSTRNKLLNIREIKKCSLIVKKLISVKNKVKKKLNYSKNIFNIKRELMNNFKIKIDYLELRNENNLSKKFNKNNFRVFIAYHIGKVRLIDNL